MPHFERAGAVSHRAEESKKESKKGSMWHSNVAGWSTSYRDVGM